MSLCACKASWLYYMTSYYSVRHVSFTKKCQNAKTSPYQPEIMSEKCSVSHLQSYRNQADVLDFLSQQSEYSPIKCVEIIHYRSKTWPGLVFYARITEDWITQAEIGNMFCCIKSCWLNHLVLPRGQ